MKERLQVGINYPWIDYAWDFGHPPAAWIAAQDLDGWRIKKRHQIVEDFRAFAEMGLFAVRWFLLADGLSYGTGNEAPQELDGQWTFDPLPREHSFHQQLCDDFEFVLKTCADLQLKFVPSLIDFHWCHRGTVVDAKAKIIKGARAEIVCDEVKRTEFLDNVLEPLLERSLNYHDMIYAWELINEPEWVTETPSFFSFRRDQNKTVKLEEMLEFIAAGTARINDRRLPDGSPAFRSTVGFAHWDTIEKWDSARLGVTLPQFHYYAPDRRQIPPSDLTSGTDCFIGEFATTFHRGWPELQERDFTGTISARLRCLEEKGYAAAFLWSARATDDATHWMESDQDEAASFIKSLRNTITKESDS